MALAERHLNATYGDALVDHRTWVVAGDGCLMEGINHEAIGLAGHLKLGRMIVLWDDNKITIDGGTDLSTNEDIPARYRAAGWHTESCDGHDSADIERAIAAALADGRPSLVACRTVIGKGAPNKQGTHAVHGAALGADEVAATRSALGWSAPAFEIPADILADWRSLGAKGAASRSIWEKRLANDSKGNEFSARIEGNMIRKIESQLEELEGCPKTLRTAATYLPELILLATELKEIGPDNAELQWWSCVIYPRQD
jgi:transketolase